MSDAVNFTRAILAAIPVPESGKRKYVRDVKTRGLTLSITDKGTRTFVYYRKVAGKPRKIALGRFEDLSIEQARCEADRLNAKVASGWDPVEERKMEAAKLTLQALFETFIEHYGRANIKYAWQYERQFNRYFTTEKYGGLALANSKASEVTRADIAKVFGNLCATRHALTANRILSMIASVFSWGERSGLVTSNPAKGIRKNGERKYQRDRFLTHREMPHFFEAVRRHPIATMRDYVFLSLFTGQRQANILAMRWSEIDFHQKLWRIPSSKTKTAREYLVPLVPEVLEIIDRRRSLCGLSPFVLDGKGESGHFAEPKKGWARILIRAETFGLINAIAEKQSWNRERVVQTYNDVEYGLEKQRTLIRQSAEAIGIEPSEYSFGDLRLHDLRRTLASWQASTGASLVAISKTLNHANVATTSIYARLQTDPVRHAIGVAATAMIAAAKPAP